jgi:pimeloyl-ACP methyl ester carboxylesterase
MTSTSPLPRVADDRAAVIRGAIQGVIRVALRWALNSLGRVSSRVAGRLAFEVWRRPQGRSRVRSHERGIHAAARVSSVDHEDLEVVTYAWGDGVRPVLLVHGWSSRASRFAAVVDGLVEQGYSPVAYDAPGHGGTPGRAGSILDHQAIIASLEVRHGPFAGIVAHSLGVPIALYAIRQGLRVDRVVTIAGLCDFAYLVDAFCAELGLTARVNAGLQTAIERSLFQGDPDIWTRFSADQPTDCDILVIHDSDDEVISPGQATLLATAFGDRATRVETAGLGHGDILRDPDVVGTAVSFLTEERIVR